MNWAIILTALSLAVGSYLLVFLYGWDAWTATAALGIGSLLILMALLALLTLLVGRTGRGILWSAVLETIKRDWRDIVHYFSRK